MSEIIVIEAAADEDLSAFSRFLWQQKITHRILVQDDKQLLLVGNKPDADYAYQSYPQFRQGVEPEAKAHQPSKPATMNPKKVPVTLLLALLSVAGYFLVSLDSNFEIVRTLTFFYFDQAVSGQVIFALPTGEYWRLVTPIFLHFSILHIVFNTLWLWDLGRRVEKLQGSLRMLALVLLIGMGSNIIQAMFAQVSIFGGMSGVIYGLLGYAWVWSGLRPEKSLGVPAGVISIMLIWLVACMLGVAELLGAGAVANAAHLGGLIMGLILGAAAALIDRTADS